MTNEKDAPLLVSIPEAARLLSVGRTTLYGLIDAGDLASTKIGKRHLVVRASIANLIQRRANTPVEPKVAISEGAG